MEQRRVTFDNGQGQELVGILHEPDARPAAWVLFAHCFTCTKNIKAAVHVSQALVEQGFAVLRFDFTGLGESEGAFVDTTFSSNIHDLLAAAKYLEREHQSPAVLVGHSLGGAAVLRAAAKLASVQAVSTIAAPADPGHVQKLLGDQLQCIRENGQGEVQLEGRAFTIGREFLDDLERDDWRDVIHDLRRPLLIFHSPVDTRVSIDNAQLIYENAMHPKSFVSLEDADHLLNRASDSRYVAAVLAAWVTRYLDKSAAGAEVEQNFVAGVVATTGRKKYRTEVRAGEHFFIADEPEKVGGGGLGPSPYDLLAASLATCTSMTLRMYADRKKLDLTEVTVNVKHDRIHEEDCENCEEQGHRIDRLQREIQVNGDLSAEERQRLIEIADRCPVHKTLSNKIRIETRERDQE